MAGVAEFTMGFGLIWTPLVRRLSALALFVIFNAAGYPFGRIDLIGHGLIMAIVLTVAADHSRAPTPLARRQEVVRRPLAGVPLGLTAALVMFASGYWGLHIAFYGVNGRVGATTTERATHSHSPEYPHGPMDASGKGAPPTR